MMVTPKLTTRMPWWVGIAIAVSLAFSRGSLAAGNEPARIRVAATLVDEVVRGLLPIVLPVPLPVPTGTTDGEASLAELQYCGAGEKGAGHFRAVIRLGAGARATSLLPSEKACGQSLAELAKRVPADPESAGEVALADVDATWKPWELKLMVVRVLGLGAARSGRSRLVAGLECRRELLAISTADFRFDTGAGDPIVLHAAPMFFASAIDVAIGLHEKGGPSPLAAWAGSVDSHSSDANVAVDVPTAFLNQLLRQLTWPGPLAIPVNGDTIDLQHLSVAGEGAGMAVAGNATPRSIGETVRVAIALRGEDLAVSSVRAEARLDDCAGQGGLASVGCNLQNVARNAASDAFASALTQRYQGALVRELASPQTFRFTVAGRRLVLRGDWLRLGFGARGLSATARLKSGDD
jgi:hypothetical protein